MSINVLASAEVARVDALHALQVLDTPREERFDRLVRLTQRMFDVPMAAVNFIDADRQWTKAEVGLDGLESIPPGDSMCRYTVQQPNTLIVPDLTVDERFRENRFVVGEARIRFYAGHPLCAPGGERVGTLCLFDTRTRQLDAREQEILVEMAGLVERELVAQRELDRAAEVQQVLMSCVAPDLTGYEVAGRCVPTQDIGGDFFSWHVLPDGLLQLHLADVMGKGIPAALIAASVRAMLVGAAQFNDQQTAVQRTAVAAQPLLTDTGAFVTAFSARLDPGTGRVDYVDAGHGLAVVYDPRGGYRRLFSSGPPLGILPGTVWDLHTTFLAPGETLVVVSDGFLDFFDSVETALAAAGQITVVAPTVEELVEEFTVYARGRARPDDVTVVALRRAGV